MFIDNIAGNILRQEVSAASASLKSAMKNNEKTWIYMNIEREGEFTGKR